jgi:hypothetical protein
LQVTHPIEKVLQAKDVMVISLMHTEQSHKQQSSTTSDKPHTPHDIPPPVASQANALPRDH